nr:glycerophosphodiester phosphodiesterase [Dyella sp. A6]
MPLPHVEKPLAARVRVIGHRGAPVWFPEHTLASYARAMADGADFVEPDLVMSRDGVLVIRHENEIGTTTDVAKHAAFADRRSTRTIDGTSVTGWFTEDFTLAELKTLRARERLPQLRGTAHDGVHALVTLEEFIEFVAAESAALGRVIGIIPEIKHGTYFRQRGLPMEDVLLDALATHAYTRSAPVEIQSFEVGNLKYLRSRLGDAYPQVRLLQLMDAPARQPFDVVARSGTLTYGQMMTPAGLAEVAGYADAIGPALEAIIPSEATQRLGVATTLVRDAHRAGLEVHPYTFRPENGFLPRDYWLGDDPDTRNEAGLVALIGRYLEAGIDAFFTDDVAAGCRALRRSMSVPGA